MEILSLIALLGLFLFVLGFGIFIKGVFKLKVSSIFFGVIVTLIGFALTDSPSNITFTINMNKENSLQIDNCSPIAKTEVRNYKYIYCSSGQIVHVRDEEYTSNQLPIVEADQRVLDMYNSGRRFYYIVMLIFCLLVLYYFYKLIKICRKNTNKSNNQL